MRFYQKKWSNHKGNWYSVVNRNWSYAIQTYSQYCPHPNTTWHLVRKNTRHIKHPKVFSNKRRVESAKCSFTRDSVWWFLLILSFKFANKFWVSNSCLKLKEEVADTSEQSTIFMENPWPFTIWERPELPFLFAFSRLLSLSFWSCWHGHHMSAMCCCTVLRWQYCFSKTSGWKNSPFYHPHPSPDFPLIISMMMDLQKLLKSGKKTFLAYFLLK